MPLLLPFFYYGYCFISAGRSFKGSLLLLTGIPAHLLIILFCFLAVGKGGGFLVIGPLILAPFWLFMYLQRKHSEGHPNSGGPGQADKGI
jgi:hypothetical protein